MFAIILLSVLGFAAATNEACPTDKCPAEQVARSNVASLTCAATACTKGGDPEYLTGNDLTTCCVDKQGCPNDQCPGFRFAKSGTPLCAGQACTTSGSGGATKLSGADITNCCDAARATLAGGVITVGYTGITASAVEDQEVQNAIITHIEGKFDTALTTAPNTLTKLAQGAQPTASDYAILVSLETTAGASNTVDVTFKTSVATMTTNLKYTTDDAQKTAMNTVATTLLSDLTSLQSTLQGVSNFNAQATVVKKDVAVAPCVLDTDSTGSCPTPAASPTGAVKPSSDPAAEAGGANAGVIAGAVIGSLAGVIIIGVIVYCTCCKKDDTQS